MNNQFLNILFLLNFVFFISCVKEDEQSLYVETGEVYFSVIDTTTVVDIDTKALTGFDVNDFNVSLSRNENPIFTNEYGNIVGTTITCSAGSGYLITAESCTEKEAESANSNWGKARVAGKKAFEVKANEINNISVNCALANTGLKVSFSDYIKKTFSEYSITFYAADNEERNFTINKDNTFKTAYFNVGSENRALQYTVNLSLKGYAPYSFTESFTLEPSKTYQITVKMKDETMNKISISVTADGELIGEEDFTETINPYKPLE